MINELNTRIKELESIILQLMEAQSPDSTTRREAVKRIVGDAELFITRELIFLRKLQTYYANNLSQS